MPGKVRQYPNECMLNKVIGRLLVTDFKGHEFVGKVKYFLWKVQCSCGTVKTMRHNRLRGINPTRSCGCLLKESYNKLPELSRKRNTKEEGVAAFNHLIYAYKQRSKRKKISFELTTIEFRDITSKNCFYCGISPYKLSRPDRNTNGDYSYNGIDRIDSNVGYVIENCVPCCEICNKAKRDLSIEEFEQWVRRISNHLPNWCG